MSLEHHPARQSESAVPNRHHTRAELAERLRLDPVTVTRNWRAWGLRPIRLGGRLLFPDEQIVDLERRAMAGEFTR
jgi:hypothetical protein